jgi:protein TonB
VIRKSYNENVTVSLILSGAFFGLLALAAVMGSNFKKGPDKNTLPKIDTGIVVVIPPPDPKPPTEKTKVIPDAPKPPTDNISYKPNDKAKPDSTGLNESAHIVKGGDSKGKDTAHNELPVIPHDPPKEINTDPVRFVDAPPEFNGNVYKFITDNIKYPRAAIENGTSGMVGLSFIIEKDGSISNISVLKSVADGCTEEAIRVVNLMPKWKPGKNHGEPMRVIINLPVSFRLK